MWCTGVLCGVQFNVCVCVCVCFSLIYIPETPISVLFCVCEVFAAFLELCLDVLLLSSGTVTVLPLSSGTVSVLPLSSGTVTILPLSSGTVTFPAVE